MAVVEQGGSRWIARGMRGLWQSKDKPCCRFVCGHGLLIDVNLLLNHRSDFAILLCLDRRVLFVESMLRVQCCDQVWATVGLSLGGTAG